MANKILVKRTSVSGRTPNTSNPSNTTYISAGEFALNLTDGILYTSNGSALITIGANLNILSVSNATVSNTLFVNRISANGGFGTTGQVLTSNGSDTYWSTPSGGGGATAYSYYDANVSISVYSMNLIDTSNGVVYVTLPTPSQGDWVKIADGGGDKYTQPAIILRNGETINGSNTDLELDIPNVMVEMVYTGTTWKVFTL